jgi:hypothetical protein
MDRMANFERQHLEENIFSSQVHFMHLFGAILGASWIGRVMP